MAAAIPKMFKNEQKYNFESNSQRILINNRAVD